MADDIDKEKDLSQKIKTAVRFEEQLKTPLTEEDKIHINEITSDLVNFLKKNEQSEIKENFFSKFKLPSFNFQILGSAMASLAIGFFVGQQFLVENITPLENQFLTKSVDFIEQEKLISLVEQLEPGKKVAFDINDNILVIFSMSEDPIEERNDCHAVELQINGIAKNDSVELIACSKRKGNQIKWELLDIK